MKKISTLFALFIFISLPLLNQAQILISTMDMPRADDIYPVYSFNPGFGLTNYAETGANHTWNYTTLSPDSSHSINFIKTQDSPVLYQIFYLNASMASANSEPSKPIGFDLGLEDAYDYFIKTNRSFEYLGYCASVGGIPIPATFQSPDTVWSLPLHYGDKDSCFSKFELSIPGSIYFGEERKRVVNVDGWGKLNLPSGQYDVLRAKVEVIRDDSVFIDSSQTGFNIPPVTDLEYVWLTKNHGVPVLRVKGTSIFSFFLPSKITYTANGPTGFDISDEEGLVLTLFPNPAKDNAILQWKMELNPHSVEVFDASGKLIQTMEEGLDRKEIEIKGLNAGLYLVRLNADSHSFSRKLIID